MSESEKFKKAILRGLLILILGGIGGLLLDRVLFPYLGTLSVFKNVSFLTNRSTLVITRREETTIDEGINYADVLNKTKNSVVSVYIHDKEFGTPKFRILGQVSGLVVSSDGLIAAPLPDVRPDVLFTILFADQGTKSAKLVVTDPLTGLSLLKVESNNLPVVKQGFSQDIQAGERLLVIGGNELPLHPMLKSVLVSKDLGTIPDLSVVSEFGALHNFLITDPQISNGEMVGAAVVNKDSALMGIVTSIDGQPKILLVEDFKMLLDNYFDDGKVIWPKFQISYQAVGENFSQLLGLPKKYGMLVKTASEPFEAGDFIYSVDGTELGISVNFDRLFLAKKPGQKAKVKLIRSGKDTEIEIELKA